MNATIDLEKELIRENTKFLATEEAPLNEQLKLDAEVDKIHGQDLMAELGFDYSNADAKRIRAERAAFAHLPQNRIMSQDAIRSTCIKYGLRFLPTRFYKGALDAGIGPKLEEFKAMNGGKLPVTTDPEMLGDLAVRNGGTGKPQMYIAAPAESFVLQPRPRDPLLFCRLSAFKYYLLHKWGDDLKTGDLRKGETTEHNWNSNFSNREETMQGQYMRSLGGIMNQTWASSTANPTTFTTTGLGGWIADASSTTAGLTFNNGSGGSWALR